MAMIALPWHAGEQHIHTLLGGLDRDNPTTPALNLQASNLLQRAPLLAVGTLDADGKPWTTLWGGNSGMGQSLGGSMIGVKTRVDGSFDPVVKALFKGREIVQETGKGKMVSALTIDLVGRKRVKLAGRFAAGAIKNVAEDLGMQSEVQIVARIDQSLGNCPKYLNSRTIVPAPTFPELLSDSPRLSPEAIDLISGSDLFFISSSNADADMDTNHRGGSAGFTRVSQTAKGTEIIWPEYSGNRLYQTLGNLINSPQAGLVFPDFTTGNAVYITGTTKILIGKDAAELIPRSNLAVKLMITAARHVRQSLPFRGTLKELSPYNPKVRPLATESAVALSASTAVRNTATLIFKENITPSIARFRFSISNPSARKAGQWVALDLSEELDIGYSHMRDDDPTSLNDDFIRTFTVSSPPEDDQFEIMIRRIGPVTSFLFKQNPRAGLEVTLQNFGGDFAIEQRARKITPFVAGGVGITPLLALIPSLDLTRIRLFWTLHAEDVDLVLHILVQHAELAKSTTVYLTGVNQANSESTEESKSKIVAMGASCEMRRLQCDDLINTVVDDTWYICVGTNLKATLLQWLNGKDVVFEDFNF